MSARSLLAAGVIVLALTGCGRGSAPEDTSSTGAAEPSDVATAAAAADTADATDELGQELERLVRLVERGSLDEAAVPAYRLRDLARGMLGETRDLSAVRRARLEAAVARLGEVTIELERAALRADLGATREHLVAVRAAVGEFMSGAEGLRLAPHKDSMESRQVRLRGEIIDPQCYFTHDGRGADHAACAVMCARGGQDLAFLDESNGQVYPLIAAAHGMDPNAGLYPHVGHAVDMEGVLFRRGATAFLIIQKVDGREVVPQ